MNKPVVTLIHVTLRLAWLAVVMLGSSCGTYSSRVVSYPTSAVQRLQASGNIQEEVDLLAQPLIDSGEVYGMSVGVLAPDGSTHKFGYGKSGRPGDSLQPGGDDVFQIASVSKLFTAALLTILVDEGKLHYDDTVRSIMPPGTPLGDGVGDITLHELITHTSGIPRQPIDLIQFRYLIRYLFTGRNLYGFIDKPYLYQYLRTCTIPPKSHHEYAYSNIGIALMGHLIEIKTGKSFPDLVEEKICRPLKMRDTVFTLNAGQRKRLVVGHVGDQPKFLRRNTPTEAWDTGEIMRASGGMYSTVNDLLRFAKANVGSPGHPPERHFAETHQVKLQTPKEDVALGWLVNHFEQQRVTLYYNHGMISGYSAYVGMNLEQRIAVVVLFSNFNWNEKIGHELLLALSDGLRGNASRLQTKHVPQRTAHGRP